MPDIKLRDGSGIEQTYQGVDTITVPLADGTGTWTYGLTDEDLNLSDGIAHYYTFAEGSPLYKEDYFNDNYILKRTDFSSISNDLSNAFYNNQYITDLSDIQINFGGNPNGIQIDSMFSGCINLEYLPEFTFDQGSKIHGNMSNSIFYYCENLKESELYKASVLFDKFYSTPQNPLFAYNYMIENFDFSNFEEGFYSITSNYNYWEYGRIFIGAQEYQMKSITLPAKVNPSSKITSSSYGFGNYVIGGNSYPMLNSMKFTLDENDQPYQVNMKGQNCLLGGKTTSYNWGWAQNNSYFTELYDRGIVNSLHNVFYDTSISTVEDAQQAYNNLKQYDDWHSCSSKKITYNGTPNVYIAILFSRFNHDSYVDLFNTLPDTSQYLAEVGGTNVLTLPMYQGDLTDEGGVSDLTQAEIQVATDKGWTVQIV